MLAEQIKSIQTNAELPGPGVGLAPAMRQALGEFDRAFDRSDLPGWDLVEVGFIQRAVVGRILSACEGIQSPRIREMMAGVAPLGPLLLGQFAEVLPRVFYSENPDFHNDDVRQQLGGRGVVNVARALGECSSSVGGTLRQTFFSAEVPVPGRDGHLEYSREVSGHPLGMMEANFELTDPEGFLKGSTIWEAAVRRLFGSDPISKEGGCPAQAYLRTEGASLLEDVAQWTARQHQHVWKFPVYPSPWMARIWRLHVISGVVVPFPLNPSLYQEPGVVHL